MGVEKKVKIECPRCDGKGVLPQYYYNRKGICFLCWGAKVISVKVPDGKTKEEVIAELKKREQDDLRSAKNQPKVPLPDSKIHKNKNYFKDAKTHLKNAKTTEQYVAEKIGQLSSDNNATAKDWEELLKIVKSSPDYPDKDLDIVTIQDAIKLLNEDKPETNEDDKRIGQVVKSKGGDITIIATAGRYNIGSYTNAKTGKTEYTVFPEDKLDKDEWEKYKSDMKQFGGYYSRFKGKWVMEDNPTEAVKNWVAGNPTPTPNPNPTPKPNGSGKPSGTSFQYMNKVQADLDSRGKDLWDLTKDELQKIKDDLDHLGVSPRVKRFYDRVSSRLEERKRQEEAGKEAEAWLSKYSDVNPNGKSIKELQAIISEGETYRYKNSDARDKLEHYESVLQSKINEEIYDTVNKALSKMGKDSIDKLNADELSQMASVVQPLLSEYASMFNQPDGLKNVMNQLKARRDELKKQAINTVSFKDTPLANKVKAIVGKGLDSTKQAQEVGEVIREEVEKRYLKNKEKIDKIEKRIQEIGVEKQPYADRLDELRPLRSTGEYAGYIGDEKWKRAWNEAVEPYLILDKEEDKLTGAIEKNPMAKIIREVMGEVREMGENVQLKYQYGHSKLASARVDKMRTMLPKEWIDSLASKPINTQNSSARNFYRNQDRMLSLGTHLPTVVHEMCHGVQWSHDGVMKLIKNYYNERTAGMPDVWMGGGAKETEVYKASNNGTEWLHKYIGRNYNRDSHEVLTMGVQLSYERSYEYMMQDADYYRFILGVMAGA